MWCTHPLPPPAPPPPRVGAVGMVRCHCAANYAGDDRMVAACEVCQAQQRVGNFAMPAHIPHNYFAQCTVAAPYVAACASEEEVFCEAQGRCLFPHEQC